MKKGNILIISVMFITICIVIILFVMAIFMCHVNSILYNFKLEMYSINKSAIIAVNKNQTSMDDFSYNKKSYMEYFENVLKESYGLNDDFRNEDKLITEINIQEYEIYEKGNRDSFTRNICTSRVIHTVIEVKIRPIIMKQLFENIFVFDIHEDVNLNLANMEE